MAFVSAVTAPDAGAGETDETKVTGAGHASDMRSELAAGAHAALFDRMAPSSDRFRPRFVTNSARQGRKISAVIEEELSKCSAFDFSVAFVTQSGIQGLLQVLSELERAGVPGRILTTDYLAFSEPRALERLDRLSNVEVRMFRTGDEAAIGFHTKGYLFHYPDGLSKVLIGSANLTASALNVNHEWNLQFTSAENGELLHDVICEFDCLWERSTSLSGYIDAYRKIHEDKRRALAKESVVTFEQASLEPNAMQVSFMESLAKSMAEGRERALLVSATGTGKTYAAAFAVRNIEPPRMLFLAHREQVLKQSKASFERVLGSGSFGLLSGNSHDEEATYLFATMQTLGKSETLRRFDPHAFDIIVIDEVHRAGSESYRRIMEHFKPRLYLGMTASPDRPDGFDIYGLFDNNIVQEIRLAQALEEDLLCPFHYFGITDLSVDGVPVDETSDFTRLVSEERIAHILDRAEYFGFSGPRVKGLMFCRTVEEAQELSRRFNERGLRTVALSGADSQEARERAIERLAADEGDALYPERLDYILSVDIFNEGVDIPEVNQVIMLRPTVSPIVFVQQLGRGLRKSADKEFVVILDFIGNYANNYMIPLALSGNRSYNKDDMRKFVLEGERTIPGVSSVHFDEIARQRVFESIDATKVTLRMLKENYVHLKHKLGRIPSMVDFLEHGEMDPMLFVGRSKSYYRFVAENDAEFAGVFTEEEQILLEYLSRYVANGMRPHELLALMDVAQGESVDFESLGEELATYFSIDFDEKAFESTVAVLDRSFVNTQKEKETYAGISVIDFDDERFEAGSTLAKLLESSAFRDAFFDLIDFGLRRYEEKYAHADGPFKLYEKYTRKDACRLLNWPTDDSATVYGYRIKHGTCPIFVTYNKDADIADSTRYEDAFVDPDTFSWMTRSRLTLDSAEVKQIIDAHETGLELHLFAKKSDGEGGDFYYLGPVTPTDWRQTTIRDDAGNELPIVNFTFKLETTVKDDIYGYFTDDAA